jgi:hypothetical protein
MKVVNRNRYKNNGNNSRTYLTNKSRYQILSIIQTFIPFSLIVIAKFWNHSIVKIVSDMCNLQMADNESICFSTSKSSIPRERREMVRPLARKDIFYSGSVMNLPEFKSQKSLASYRQSVISLPKYAQERGDVVDVEKGSKLHVALVTSTVISVYLSC